jgi:hypothetical protein
MLHEKEAAMKARVTGGIEEHKRQRKVPGQVVADFDLGVFYDGACQVDPR